MTDIPVPDFDLNDFSDDEYEIKLLLHRPKFIEGVYKLRKKWNIPPEGLQSNKEMNAWVEQLGKRKKVLKDELRVFSNSLGLSERWDDAIYQYLELNSPGMLRTQLVTPIELKYKGNRSKTEDVISIWIQIDAQTTKQEILESFNHAKDLFKHKPLKKQKAKRLNQDLEIWRMHQRGKAYKEIADDLQNDETEERALTSDDIGLIIRRMAERLE